MKEKYLPASIELVAFENTDVIATSYPSPTPNWNDENVDSGGWT